MTDTDHDWERWGRQDPYYSVITDPRFRRSQLNDAERDYFFHTGQLDVDRVMGVIHERIAPDFAPARVLDFGCGVGRMLFSFARTAAEVVGVDVAPTMLTEAALHRDRLGLQHVELLQGGDTSPLGHRQFDLVHSGIVLQHLEVPRGLALFADLLQCVAPGGIGAIQVTYSRHDYAHRLGEPPAPPPPERKKGQGLLRSVSLAKSGTTGGDPGMLMNTYSLTQLFFLIQRAGFPRVHSEFTDHGGELGVHLYFQRPSAD